MGSHTWEGLQPGSPSCRALLELRDNPEQPKSLCGSSFRGSWRHQPWTPHPEDYRITDCPGFPCTTEEEIQQPTENGLGQAPRDLPISHPINAPRTRFNQEMLETLGVFPPTAFSLSPARVLWLMMALGPLWTPSLLRAAQDQHTLMKDVALRLNLFIVPAQSSRCGNGLGRIPGAKGRSWLLLSLLKG